MYQAFYESLTIDQLRLAWQVLNASLVDQSTHSRLYKFIKGQLILIQTIAVGKQA